MTPQAPSTDRNDPAVRGQQTLVYDSVGGAITIAGDGVPSGSPQWLNAAQLLVRTQNRFAVYDAAARTWRAIDLNLAFDDKSTAIASRDGARVAAQLADRSLVLLDMRAGTYRSLSLQARPITWSPDSARLLVAHDGQSQSVITAANPTAAIPLPGVPPRGTPDYRWLTSTRIVDLQELDETTAQLRVLDVSGTSARLVLNEVVALGRLSTSPDGRLLAISRGRLNEPEGVETIIYRLDPFQRVASHPGLWLLATDAWTSDSKQLIASRNVCTGNESVVVLNLDTGHERTLLSGALLAPISFGVSPDNRTLAFAPGSELYVAPLDGSAPPRSIFSPTAAPVPPAWSSDGRFIAFARFFGGYGRCP
jgi:hypothetical protein